ncbi:MAG: hypothetical protein LAP40_05475 [Acidobacteriia bacterium]|nr:hypothetical protein [Terriglobia bacterium]
MDESSLKPDQRLQPAPEKTAFDYAMAVAKVAAIPLPFFGRGVALVDAVTAPLRGKRFDDWCEQIRQRINEPSQKIEGLTAESLATSDPFISMFTQASQAAIRTHKEEKLEALRNAMMNVAISPTEAEDLRSVFLNMIDTFSVVHLRLLRFFQRPEPGLRDEYRRQRPLTDQVIRDLNDRGLISDSRPYAARGRDDSEALVYYDCPPTPLGEQFLQFIGRPR